MAGSGQSQNTQSVDELREGFSRLEKGNER